MREGVGSVFAYNFIIFFLLVVFGLALGVVSYFKAFKVNNHIADAIEKYEGYNKLAVAEANTALLNVGYRLEPNFTCPKYKDTVPLPTLQGVNHKYCVYLYNEGANYRSYGIVTYMNVELPLVGEVIRLPIYSKTIRLYDFG